MTPEQEIESIEFHAIAEDRVDRWRRLGVEAAEALYRAQWAFGSPDWFDHRFHFLDPAKWFRPHFFLALARVMMHLPVNGRVLDLCSGDCWVDRWVYAPRASDVFCIDRNGEAMRHAAAHNGHPNIRRMLCTDLLDDPEVEKRIDAGQYDVVVMRGAIEHFKAADQPRVYALAKRAMRPGTGWFVGDTCTDARHGLFDHHERVYQSAEELEADLKTAFSTVRVETFHEPHSSAEREGFRDRTTFIWECQA